MHIYLLTQTENDGYDTYDSIIVVAPDVATAILINPHGYIFGDPEVKNWGSYHWCSNPSYVKAQYLGVAHSDYDEPEVILASFNAG